MIFRPEMLKQVLAGEKTETRRPVKAGKKCQYRPFRTYAIQAGRGQKEIDRLRVREVKEERLGDIDSAGARREGFRDRDAFFAYWRKLYGDVDEDQRVWVISFRLVETHPEPDEASIIDFEEEKHWRRAGQRVLLQGWVLSDLRYIAAMEKVNVLRALARAIKFYKFVCETRQRNGEVQLVDSRGTRWYVDGYDEDREKP